MSNSKRPKENKSSEKIIDLTDNAPDFEKLLDQLRLLRQMQMSAADELKNRDIENQTNPQYAQYPDYFKQKDKKDIDAQINKVKKSILRDFSDYYPDFDLSKSSLIQLSSIDEKDKITLMQLLREKVDDLKEKNIGYKELSELEATIDSFLKQQVQTLQKTNKTFGSAALMMKNMSQTNVNPLASKAKTEDEGITQRVSQRAELPSIHATVRNENGVKPSDKATITPSRGLKS